MTKKTKTDICPMCGGKTTRANFVLGALRCDECETLFFQIRDRIIRAFVTTASGNAFGNACAESAAKDIITILKAKYE